jgi:RNA polymerase sigma-70 factor (ECF subfamily)
VAVDQNKPDEHLSQMSTAWTVLFQAHEGAAEAAGAARRRLLERYAWPVGRYLRAAARDPDAAEELYQEFALKFLRGDFQRAHPDRGRFRDFLKTVLYHLVVDYHKWRGRRPGPLPSESHVVAPEDEPAAGPDAAFLKAWRAELLKRSWEELARSERETGQPLYTVLRYRTDHPEMRSHQMAEGLTGELGRPITAGWVRKQLHFARERLADLLLKEVLLTVESASPEDLAGELIDLGLLEYCRAALERYTQAATEGKK